MLTAMLTVPAPSLKEEVVLLNSTTVGAAAP